MESKIVVLVKLYKGDISPFDAAALECALSIPNSEVTVISMAPLSNLEALENLTRLGCEAVLINDEHYAGSDTVRTACILSNNLMLFNADYIFTGRESMDGNTGQVPAMIAQITGYEYIHRVMKMEGDELTLRNGRQVELKKHQIVSFEKIRVLRDPSIFSQKKKVRVLKFEDAPCYKVSDFCNSPTRVIKTTINQSDRRFCKYINYSDLDSVIKTSLDKKNVENQEVINKATVIHYVGNIYDIATKYAKKAIKLDVENKSVVDIIELIKKNKAKIVLWEESDKYKPLASMVAVSMGYGLCADCTSFRFENNQFIMTRPALGGDVIADIICDSEVAMATVRATNNDNEDVAITIGKGAIEHLDKIKELAKRYNAKIYCTRPLADNDILPYETQVGLTGINISPKVCITIGTSGAIQHIVGINKSQTIIAININKKEKVFDYADYGIVMDAKDI